MTRTGTFLLGAVVGAALGIAAPLAIRGPDGGSTDAAPSESGSQGRAPASLMGRGGGAPTPVPAGSDDGDGGDVAVRFEQRVEGRRDAWLLLAQVYAACGSLEDLRRACDRALEAGADPTAVLTILESRPTVKRDLVRRHPEVAWDPGVVAGILGAVGEARESAASALEALRRDRAVRAALRDGTPVDPAFRGLHADQMTGLLAQLAASDPVAAAREAAALVDVEPGLAVTAARGLRDALPDVARSLLRKCLASYPLDLRALEMLGRMDAAWTVAHVEAIVAKDPSSRDAWLRLADARGWAGDARGAFDACAKATELDPHSDQLYELLAMDPVAALPVLLRVTEGSLDPYAWDVRAQALLQNGRGGEAVDAFLRAQEIDAMGRSYREEYAILDPSRVAKAMAPHVERAWATENLDFLLTYARTLRAAGDATGASEVLARAAERGMIYGDAWSDFARSSPEKALPVLEAKRAASPKDADVARALGDAYAGLGRRADAVAAYLRALEVGGPQYYAGMVALARVDPAGGIDRLKQEIARSESGDAWAALGDAYRELGRGGEARAAYEKALAEQPDNLLWLARLATTR